MRIPAGKRYSGADTGFNALVIAAATNVNGLIVPWCAGFRFHAVSFILALTSAVINVTLRIRIVDFNGQTELSAPGVPLQIVQNANNQYCGVFFGLDTPRATVGTAVAVSIPAVLGAPYARFNVNNIDAVNAVTVTLQAILHSDRFEE